MHFLEKHSNFGFFGHATMAMQLLLLIRIRILKNYVVMGYDGDIRHQGM